MSPSDSTASWTAAERDAFMARRRARNLALGLLLGALVVLFFGITVVRMTGQKMTIPGTARSMAPPPVGVPVPGATP